MPVQNINGSQGNQGKPPFPVVPTHLQEMDLKGFETYLLTQDCKLRPPTNSYEVCRYVAPFRQTPTGAICFNTCIIYRKANGRLTYTGQSHHHYKSFLTQTAMNVVQGSRVTPVVQQLMHRDGDLCFYCAKKMEGDDVTIEHLLAKSKDGPNRMENLALAHFKCNVIAANKSVVDKVELREMMRARTRLEQQVLVNVVGLKEELAIRLALDKLIPWYTDCGKQVGVAGFNQFIDEVKALLGKRPEEARDHRFASS